VLDLASISAGLFIADDRTQAPSELADANLDHAGSSPPPPQLQQQLGQRKLERQLGLRQQRQQQRGGELPDAVLVLQAYPGRQGQPSRARSAPPNTPVTAVAAAG
jgi:hypothetical protein